MEKNNFIKDELQEPSKEEVMAVNELTRLNDFFSILVQIDRRVKLTNYSKEVMKHEKQ